MPEHTSSTDRLGAGPIALTNAQRLMWVGQQLAPEAPLYNMAMAFTIEGAVDADRFEAAFQAVVDRSDALRTVVEGEGRARVLPALRGAVERVDLSGTPDPEAAAQAWAAARATRTLDLRACPFDAALLRLGPARSVWFLNLHHLVTDAWSLALVYRTVAAFYERAASGTLEDAPALPPYRAYVDHEAALRAEADAPPAPVPASVPAPLYGRTPATPSTRTERVTRALGPERSARLRALAADPSVRALTPHLTLFNLFATALFAYIHRVSDAGSLVIGVPSHNRPTAVFKETIGLFIEILPFEIGIGEDETFRSLLSKVGSETLALLRRAQPGTSTAEVNRGYNVLLNYINASFGRFAGLPMRSQWVHSGHSDTGHHLRLQVHDFDDAGELVLHFDLSEALFAPAEREDAADHFLRLLDALLEDPSQLIGAPSLIGPGERERLVTEWNRTQTPAPLDQTLHARFEAQVERAPEAVAVRFEGRAVTYSELNRRANQLAHRLRALGVGPDVLVGVCLERSVEMVVALLGVLKSGGAYVPLDPDYPAARLAFMLEDADVPVLLTQRHLSNALPAVAATVLCLDDAQPGGRDDNPGPGAGPGDLAYVIYTSGSTGRPKGAMNEHRAIVNRIHWMQEVYGLGPGDRVMQKTPFSFDVSVWEFFWPLVAGATLVVARPDGHRDSAYLSELIEAEGVTTMHFVPSMLHAFLEEPTLDRCRSLRRVFCSGEALPAALARSFFARLSGVELHNLYGPTECAIEVTRWACQPGSLDESVPIGRPVANTQIYVLDGQMNPVPGGVPGELYIGGVQVGRGYLNRPELTAERFVPDPFSSEANARLYRTGDLARWRPDGVLDFLGRLDFQVKVRGFRIELGEIETALQGHDAIQTAVVVAVAADESGDGEVSPGEGASDASGNRMRLVAYYVAERPFPSAELRRYLAQTLPDYMVPSHFVRLDALPTTPSGKVDRRALPAPEAERPDLDAPFVPPHTEAEQTLAAIWRDVLRVTEVGAAENFFDLGGDSILAIQIAARAAEAGLRIAPGLLFKHQTVAALAAAAESASGPPAERGLVTGTAPLTPVQRWFAGHSHLTPWNQAWWFEAREPLDASAFQTALDALVRHHDALRLRLDGDRQAFGPPATVPVDTVDLTGQTPEDQDRAIAEAEAETHAGVDATSGALVRALHVRLGGGRGERVLVAIHHLGVDGVSWPILMEDLATAYGQARRGEAVALPRKTASFKRWAERLAERAETPGVRALAPRWNAELGAATGRLKTSTPGTEAEVRTHTVSLSADETDAVLRVTPTAHGVRVQEVMLAALAQALQPLVEGEHLRVDVEGHGRDADDALDVTRTVGWFTTLVPLALPLRADDAAGAVRQVRERWHGLPEAATYGLLRHLAADAGLDTPPPPAVLFNYLGRLDAVHDGDPVLRPVGALTLTRHPDAERMYPHEVNAYVTDGRLHVGWTAAPGTEAEVARAATTFAEALRTLAAGADAPAAPEADVSLSGLDAGGLDRLAALLRNADG